MNTQEEKQFDLVDKLCLEWDGIHAPFETISAFSSGKAKSKYHKLHPEHKFINILCRKSKIGSFETYIKK